MNKYIYDGRLKKRVAIFCCDLNNSKSIWVAQKKQNFDLTHTTKTNKKNVPFSVNMMIFCVKRKTSPYVAIPKKNLSSPSTETERFFCVAKNRFYYYDHIEKLFTF